MTFSVVALSTVHLAGLRLLSAIGGFAGFSVILVGLRRAHKGQGSLQESRLDPTKENFVRESAASQLPALPEVIHLSTDLGPARGSEMTQQQRIAAALSRAGMTNSGWSQREIHTASAVLDPPAECATESDHRQDAQPLPSHTGFNRTVTVLAGTMLALLSLVLLLILR